MIRSRSPYIVTTPWENPLGGAVSGEFYTLHIFVWDGDKSAIPGTPTYTTTKRNPSASTGTDDIDIAPILRDEIEYTPVSSPTTAILNDPNARWVHYYVTYENDPTPQQLNTQLFNLSYAHGLEPRNYTTFVDSILISDKVIEYDANDIFIFPFLADESVAKTLDYKSYPNGVVDSKIIISATTQSSELTQMLFFHTADMADEEYLEIIYDGVPRYVYKKEECRYTPVEVVFVNKDGVQQSLPFFTQSVQSLRTSKESFESNRGLPSNGKHQYVSFNVQGRGKKAINTGFIQPEMNEIITQLMLNESVWIYDVANDKFIPMNLDQGSLDYKDRIKDKLINYEIRFENSYNEIQNQ